MSYRIQYGPPQPGEPTRGRFSARTVGGLAVVALAAAVVIVLTNPQAAETFRNFLFPGDPVVTKEAFSEFLDSIRGGDSIGQAITAFCREIIQSAAV